MALRNIKVWNIKSSTRFLNVWNCYKTDLKTEKEKKEKLLNDQHDEMASNKTIIV